MHGEFHARGISIALAVVLLSGCSWVSLTPEAEEVRLLTSEAEARDCEAVGKTTVSLMDRVAGIKRSAEKVRKELITLARNSAAQDLEANAVMPISEIESGRQTFAVYRCPR
ncbi:protein of unknown function [Thiohalomonas denitrificans]|uniref:DUF4156 domain-containing protein n=1 Tax=Thiohalomonas denitrificans TaxID=415747 RepID=A0A1G5QRS3_9GAMM|nr:protein of unknown function [Thiohalomonas denitrificans]